MTYWGASDLRRNPRFVYADGTTGELTHTHLGWAITTTGHAETGLDPLAVCLYLNYQHAEPATPSSSKQTRLL